MRLTSNVGIVILTVMLLSLLSLAISCSDDEIQTPAPAATVESPPIQEPTTTVAVSPTPTETSNPIPTALETEPPAPLPTIEPIPEPTPEQTPEPTESLQLNDVSDIGSTWTHYVTYGDENMIWTGTITGEEVIDGVDCNIVERSFDAPPERLMYAEMTGSDLSSILTKEKLWISKTTLQPIKAESSLLLASMNMPIDTVSTFTYDGECGAPFSVGQSWSYQRKSVTSTAQEMTSTWNAEVVGMEEITVSADTFNCYEVVHTSGDTTIIYWTSANEDSHLVKTVSDGLWTGTETRELASYSAPE